MSINRRSASFEVFTVVLAEDSESGIWCHKMKHWDHAALWHSVVS
jgi:hypothetical protein